MKKHSLNLLALTALLVAAAPAQALTFEGAVTQGATVVNDYSAIGLLSFDLDLANGSPAVLSWRIDDEDLLAPIAFNAVAKIGEFSDDGFTGEETKMMAEPRKILSAPDLEVAATSVRRLLARHSLRERTSSQNSAHGFSA